MKFYVVSDGHSYFSIMKKALEEKGFFSDTEPHKLIICGDIMDRGPESKEMEDFVLDLMKKDQIILIRGNHEDLFLDMVDNFINYRDTILSHRSHHWSNGTALTGLDLTDIVDVIEYQNKFDIKCKETEFYKTIIPACKNYYETKNYIFVHSWIPVKCLDPYPVHYTRHRKFEFNPDWRNATEKEFEQARWCNPFEMAKQGLTTDKTIVFGHWHCSTGWANKEGRSEFDSDSKFDTFYGNGYIGIDACTAYTKKVNCIILEDDEL